MARIVKIDRKDWRYIVKAEIDGKEIPVVFIRDNSQYRIMPAMSKVNLAEKRNVRKAIASIFDEELDSNKK